MERILVDEHGKAVGVRTEARRGTHYEIKAKAVDGQMEQVRSRRCHRAATALPRLYDDSMTAL